MDSHGNKRDLGHKKNVYLYLAGGLGNQLFQLAAAVKNFPNHEIFILDEIGNVRRSTGGAADLYSYLLPNHVQRFEKVDNDHLTRRAFSYLLRSKIVGRRYENLFTKAFLNNLANRLVVKYVGEKCRVLVGQGVGYSQLNVDPTHSYILIGYFQTYSWATAEISNLRLESEPQTMLETRALANIEKPLAVHVRLGDYKNSPHFGIPNINYYHEAIKSMWKSDQYKKVWLFSDEPDLAKEYLPSDIDYRIINFPEDSSAVALERLRCCFGYVIGNSTFGWWGAIASRVPNAEVTAPEKWFRLMDDPVDLIPPHWHRLSAW
jgi:hypothetical protein